MGVWLSVPPGTQCIAFTLLSKSLPPSDFSQSLLKIKERKKDSLNTTTLTRSFSFCLFNAKELFYLMERAMRNYHYYISSIFITEIRYHVFSFHGHEVHFWNDTLDKFGHESSALPAQPAGAQGVLCCSVFAFQAILLPTKARFVCLKCLLHVPSARRSLVSSVTNSVLQTTDKI